jgi:hypothetical protein
MDHHFWLFTNILGAGASQNKHEMMIDERVRQSQKLKL